MAWGKARTSKRPRASTHGTLLITTLQVSSTMRPSGISSTPRDTTTSWGKAAQQESSGLTLLLRFILMQPTSSASLEIWVRPTILLQLWNTTCKVKAKRCCMWGTSLTLTTTLSLMATSGTPSVDLLSGAMHTSLGYGLQETMKSSTIHPSLFGLRISASPSLCRKRRRPLVPPMAELN